MMFTSTFSHVQDHRILTKRGPLEVSDMRGPRSAKSATATFVLPRSADETDVRRNLCEDTLFYSDVGPGRVCGEIDARNHTVF